MMMGADSRKLDPSRSHKSIASGRGRRQRSSSSSEECANVRATSNKILAGATGSHVRGIGLADHNGQTDGVPSTLQEDVLLDLEAELLVVGVVGE